MTVSKMNNPANKDKPWLADVSYTNWQNEKLRKRKYFATRKEAIKWETEFLNSLASNTDISFPNLVAEYIKYKKSRVKNTTFGTKENIINNKILPYFSKKLLKDISPKDISLWQNDIMSQNYAQTYLKTINAQLSAIFNYAKKFYHLDINPIHITGSIGRKYSDRMDYYTAEEFKAFWKIVEDKPASKILFPLLFYSGMREGELLALTLSDFDYNKQTVSITKTYTRLHGTDIITKPKTENSNRKVRLPSFIFDLLNEYIGKLYDYAPSDRLFPVTKSYLYHEMNRGAVGANIKKIRVHDLRHSHASMLISEGFSHILLKERLGHKNIATTLQIYAHLYPVHEENLISTLENSWI